MTESPTGGARPADRVAPRQPQRDVPRPVEPLGTIELSVSWEGEPDLTRAAPAAPQVAAILLGLEQTYSSLADAMGYPPHFLRITTLRNPELKLGLEGGKEAIEALRDLIRAIPSFVASLFRPRAALRLAQEENEAQVKRAEAQAAEAGADRAEADVRRLRAEAELAKLRQELAAIPIQVHTETHVVLREIVTILAAAEPAKRALFVGETAQYVMANRGFEPPSRIRLITQPENVATRAVPVPKPPRPADREVSRGEERTR